MKNIIRYALLISLSISVYCICSCNISSGSTKVNSWNADEYSYGAYKGKVVKSINYCKNCATSGDLMIFHFTDGTQLKVYAYKYTMKINQ